MDVILFLIFAIIAVVAAINVVVQSHPISSALSLVGVMGSLAVLYLLLGAEFIAAAQVIVYAGAVMVLFVFVIMLLNAGTEVKKGRSYVAQFLGVPLLVAFLAVTAFFVQRIFREHEMVKFGAFTGGTAEAIGRALFTTYLLPFEVT
jgi:NADH-quinone oxidoreductase subunit J